jgi:hypothetical protein
VTRENAFVYMEIRANIELSNLLFLETTYCETTRPTLGVYSKIPFKRKFYYFKKHILNNIVLPLARQHVHIIYMTHFFKLLVTF